MPELPRPSYRDPDCGVDHEHDSQCFPGLRAGVSLEGGDVGFRCVQCSILWWRGWPASDAAVSHAEEHGHELVLSSPPLRWL